MLQLTKTSPPSPAHVVNQDDVTFGLLEKALTTEAFVDAQKRSDTFGQWVNGSGIWKRRITRVTKGRLEVPASRNPYWSLRAWELAQMVPEADKDGFIARGIWPNTLQPVSVTFRHGATIAPTAVLVVTIHFTIRSSAAVNSAQVQLNYGTPEEQTDEPALARLASIVESMWGARFQKDNSMPPQVAAYTVPDAQLRDALQSLYYRLYAEGLRVMSDVGTLAAEQIRLSAPLRKHAHKLTKATRSIFSGDDQKNKHYAALERNLSTQQFALLIESTPDFGQWVEENDIWGRRIARIANKTLVLEEDENPLYMLRAWELAQPFFDAKGNFDRYYAAMWQMVFVSTRKDIRPTPPEPGHIYILIRPSSLSHKIEDTRWRMSIKWDVGKNHTPMDDFRRLEITAALEGPNFEFIKPVGGRFDLAIFYPDFSVDGMPKFQLTMLFYALYEAGLAYHSIVKIPNATRFAKKAQPEWDARYVVSEPRGSADGAEIIQSNGKRVRGENQGLARTFRKRANAGAAGSESSETKGAAAPAIDLTRYDAPPEKLEFPNVTYDRYGYQWSKKLPLQQYGPDTDVAYGTHRVLSVLGDGTYGTVYLAVNPKGKGFAIKRSKEREITQDVLVEISTLLHLHHPNIVQLVDVIRPKEGADLTPSIVLNAAHTSLDAYLNHLHPKQVAMPANRAIMYDITCAVSYLHSLQILHRDIKTNNILLFRDGTAKLADFGTSKHYACEPNSDWTDVVSSVWYRAPEILINNIDDIRTSQYDLASDIWSLGVVLYEIGTARRFVQLSEEINEYDAQAAAQLGLLLEHYRPFSQTEWPKGAKRLNRAKHAKIRDNKPLPPTGTPEPRNFEMIKDVSLRVMLQQALEWNPDRRAQAHVLLQSPFWPANERDPAREYAPTSCGSALDTRARLPTVTWTDAFGETEMLQLMVWLIEMAATLRYEISRVVYTAMDYFCIVQPQHKHPDITETVAQRYGLACLHIAALVTEYFPADFGDLTEPLRPYILEVLEVLRYDLVVTTPDQYENEYDFAPQKGRGRLSKELATTHWKALNTLFMMPLTIAEEAGRFAWPVNVARWSYEALTGRRMNKTWQFNWPRDVARWSYAVLTGQYSGTDVEQRLNLLFTDDKFRALREQPHIRNAIAFIEERAKRFPNLFPKSSALAPPLLAEPQTVGVEAIQSSANDHVTSAGVLRKMPQRFYDTTFFEQLEKDLITDHFVVQIGLNDAFAAWVDANNIWQRRIERITGGALVLAPNENPYWALRAWEIDAGVTADARNQMSYVFKHPDTQQSVRLEPSMRLGDYDILFIERRPRLYPKGRRGPLDAFWTGLRQKIDRPGLKINGFSDHAVVVANDWDTVRAALKDVVYYLFSQGYMFHYRLDPNAPPADSMHIAAPLRSAGHKNDVGEKKPSFEERLDKSRILVVGSSYQPRDAKRWAQIDPNYIAVGFKTNSGPAPFSPPHDPLQIYLVRRMDPQESDSLLIRVFQTLVKTGKQFDAIYFGEMTDSIERVPQLTILLAAMPFLLRAGGSIFMRETRYNASPETNHLLRPPLFEKGEPRNGKTAVYMPWDNERMAPYVQWRRSLS